jgi:predicted HTH transcriptional regulator
MGMANHEQGGWIVVGIEEDSDGTFTLVGIPPDNVPSWNHDDVSAMVNGVADPPISLETETVIVDDKTFVVIRVHQFLDIPVVARSNGPTPKGEKAQVYRKDTCYARSRKKPETIDAMSDPSTWRTLIELASLKEARRILNVIGVVATREAVPDDAAKFEAQLEDLR